MIHLEDFILPPFLVPRSRSGLYNQTSEITLPTSHSALEILWTPSGMGGMPLKQVGVTTGLHLRSLSETVRLPY